MKQELKRVAFCNLGCKVNSYEAQAMAELFEKTGYVVVDFQEIAEVYVVNTCTVTNIADRKSRQMLHKAKKLNPEAIVVAVGCYVQADKERLELDEQIDIMIGNNHKKDIVFMIQEYENREQKSKYIIDICEEQQYEELNIEAVSDKTRAYIKIQDGCNQFCSYCIIPYVRGRVRSRKREDIIKEVVKVVKNGYQEIVLTGIHLSSYGIDFDDNTTLLLLVRELSSIQGLQRIRLGSIEQSIITEEFIKEISKIEQFCPHFHLSLQSGCDATLYRMNRKYNTKEFYVKCQLIRKYFKNPGITTDIIVGFPGETAEEFKETKNFLNEIKFSQMHIFKYSVRKGTKAAEMKPQVEEHIKSDRSSQLTEMDKQFRKEYAELFIHQMEEVLIEEEITFYSEQYYIGHTKNYLKIAIKKQDLMLFFHDDVTNKRVEVYITGILQEENHNSICDHQCSKLNGYIMV